MANAGFDWLCLDMQHGMLDYNDIRQLLPAISTTSTIPLVRVPWNEPYEIMKVLEGYGIDCYPMQLRHMRTLSGGPHCVTLDLVRDGTLEDYS